MTRKLPKYITANHPDLPQTLVVQTVPPYLVGAPFCIPKKEAERVEEMLSLIANGRRTAVKVTGFTIFFFIWGTIQGPLPELDDAKTILREMADYYKTAVLAKKKHPNRLYEEGVPDDIDERMGRKIRGLE